MSSSPTVIVKKAGVLSSFVRGLFGLLMVCVLCAAGLGWRAMSMLDSKSSELLEMGQSLTTVLPQWRSALPVVAECLDDHRAPEYREQLSATVRMSADRRSGTPRAVIEVTNQGTETVTLLAARIVALDSDGTPRGERTTYVATPVTLDDNDWRGPLLPGSTRKFAVPLGYDLQNGNLTGSIEITDVRIWNKSRPQVAAGTASGPTLPAP